MCSRPSTQRTSSTWIARKDLLPIPRSGRHTHFSSVRRSITMVALSLVASFSRTFWGRRGDKGRDARSGLLPIATQWRRFGLRCSPSPWDLGGMHPRGQGGGAFRRDCVRRSLGKCSLSTAHVIGLFATGELRSIFGNTPGSSTKTIELTSSSDNSKMPEQVSSPSDRLAIAPTAPQAPQPSSPTASVPIAPTVAQPANKELGQNMKLGIEAAFNAANANGGCTAVSFDSWQRTTATSRRGLPRQ
jgi:hypothetical protein